MNNIQKLLEESPEAYYWAGFLMADGSFNHQHNSLELSLSKTDRGHLEKFGKFIDRPVLSYKHRNKNRFGSKGLFYRVAGTDNTHIPVLLKKFDYKQKKTYNPPTKININDDNLFLCFLIGFIDGDGSINIKRYKGREERKDCYIRIENHSSWLKILSSFRKRLYNISDIQEKHFSKIGSKGFLTSRGYAQINIGNSKAIWTLKNKIKEFNLPVLERKWLKVQDTFSTKFERNI